MILISERRSAIPRHCTISAPLKTLDTADQLTAMSAQSRHFRSGGESVEPLAPGTDLAPRSTETRHTAVAASDLSRLIRMRSIVGCPHRCSLSH